MNIEININNYCKNTDHHDDHPSKELLLTLFNNLFFEDSDGNETGVVVHAHILPKGEDDYSKKRGAFANNEHILEYGDLNERDVENLRPYDRLILSVSKKARIDSFKLKLKDSKIGEVLFNSTKSRYELIIQIIDLMYDNSNRQDHAPGHICKPNDPNCGGDG